MMRTSAKGGGDQMQTPADRKEGGRKMVLYGRLLTLKECAHPLDGRVYRPVLEQSK